MTIAIATLDEGRRRTKGKATAIDRGGAGGQGPAAGRALDDLPTLVDAANDHDEAMSPLDDVATEVSEGPPAGLAESELSSFEWQDATGPLLRLDTEKT